MCSVPRRKISRPHAVIAVINDRNNPPFSAAAAPTLSCCSPISMTERTPQSQLLHLHHKALSLWTGLAAIRHHYGNMEIVVAVADQALCACV